MENCDYWLSLTFCIAAKAPYKLTDGSAVELNIGDE